MMLVTLLPDQVSQNWHEIKVLIEESVPGPADASSARMNHILEDALIGIKKIWISYNEEGEFDGLVGTEIFIDRINGIRTLEIFALWAKGGMERRKSWESGKDALFKYAVKEKCKHVTAFTREPSLINIARDMGGDVSFTFCDITL